MDGSKLDTFTISNFAPWKITSSEMLPNILLMNKLLLILLDWVASIKNNFKRGVKVIVHYILLAIAKDYTQGLLEI